MKITPNLKQRTKGFVIVLVMIMCAVSLIILSGVLYRTSTVSLLNLRNTQLSVLNNAAEAATEKVYAKMAWDFQYYGPNQVSSNLTAYRTYVPTTSDNSFWSRIQFSDANGNVNSTYVSFLTNYTGPLPTQYPNQFATTSPIYRIVSNASMSNSLTPGVIGTAQQDVLLAEVPVSTYAIFYNGVLEFSDCATMVVNGRVHSNSYMCVGAGSGDTLTFGSPVTSCGTMSAPARGGINIWTANDPSTWLTTFSGGYSTNVASVNLAMTMTNTHSIIDIPPPTESPMSVQGQARLYNQAQVVIIVTNGPTASANPTVLVTLQTAYNDQNPGSDTAKTTAILTNVTDTYLDTNSIMKVPFLSLTNTFYDQRQGETNYVAQIDVAQYNNWLTTNSAALGKFSSSPATILYIADQRAAMSTSRQAAVRLVNATQIPSNTLNGNNNGFSVATQNPIYIQGNYNTTVAGVSGNTTAMGSTTNGASVPSAILADAITMLSPNWVDNKSSLAYNSVLRTDPSGTMTVNAALVTGAIPSTGTDANSFSGGVQNLTRFLEDWSSANLVMNTSIINLFNSQIATKQFQMPGAYYNPPKRYWAFDTTFYSRQPPGMPYALVPIRFNWKTPAPATVTSN